MTTYFQLDKQDILGVANAFPPPPGNVTFARGCLSLLKNAIDSLVDLHGDDRVKLNQSFIQTWVEQNPGQDQKKVSISK